MVIFGTSRELDTGFFDSSPRLPRRRYWGSNSTGKSEIALRRLDGDVAEQELDLVQFTAGQVAQTGTGAPQIGGASLSMPARAAAVRTTSQSTLGDVPSPHTRPALLIARNTGPSVIGAAVVQASTAVFTHVGIGTVRTWEALPTRSAITPCSSRCWIDSRRSQQLCTPARRSPPMWWLLVHGKSLRVDDTRTSAWPPT